MRSPGCWPGTRALGNCHAPRKAALLVVLVCELLKPSLLLSGRLDDLSSCSDSWVGGVLRGFKRRFLFDTMLPPGTGGISRT
jgi:hypothetical protein